MLNHSIHSVRILRGQIDMKESVYVVIKGMLEGDCRVSREYNIGTAQRFAIQVRVKRQDIC